MGYHKKEDASISRVVICVSAISNITTTLLLFFSREPLKVFRSFRLAFNIERILKVALKEFNSKNLESKYLSSWLS